MFSVGFSNECYIKQFMLAFEHYKDFTYEIYIQIIHIVLAVTSDTQQGCFLYNRRRVIAVYYTTRHGRKQER